MGCQHVDDALIGSTILCLSCLESGLKKLWPSDVGVSVEESGNKLRFFQAEVAIPNPILKEYTLTPYNPNIDFAKGLSEHQHTARLGKYRNLELTSFSDLRQFIIGRFWSFNTILVGNAAQGINSTIYLILEVAKLGWPKNWICRASKSIPGRHRSP